jgi:hypothetical protein
MRIKLFESFLDKRDKDKLKQDINDVLVEIADLGFRWEIYISKNLANWQIAVDINKEGEEEDYEDPDYGVAEIYESVMLLISFMRDKYPDVKIRYELSSNYNEEEIDEYLEENDFETIEHINATPMDAIYNFQVNFSGNFDFRKNK